MEVLEDFENGAVNLRAAPLKAAAALDRRQDGQGVELLIRTGQTLGALASLAGEVSEGNISERVCAGGRSYWSHAFDREIRERPANAGLGRRSRISASLLLQLGDGIQQIDRTLSAIIRGFPPISPAGCALRHGRSALARVRSAGDDYVCGLLAPQPGSPLAGIATRVFYGDLTSEERRTFRQACILSATRHRHAAYRAAASRGPVISTDEAAP